MQLNNLVEQIPGVKDVLDDLVERLPTDDLPAVQQRAQMIKAKLPSIVQGLKILGNGDLKAKLSVEAAAASASASAKISKAGGKITLKPIADQTEKFLPAAAKKRAAAAAK